MSKMKKTTCGQEHFPFLDLMILISYIPMPLSLQFKPSSSSSYPKVTLGKKGKGGKRVCVRANDLPRTLFSGGGGAKRITKQDIFYFPLLFFVCSCTFFLFFLLGGVLREGRRIFFFLPFFLLPISASLPLHQHFSTKDIFGDISRHNCQSRINKHF